MCGEKQRQKGAGGVEEGSPPRVRGKEYMQSKARLNSRITPACAGKREYGMDKVKYIKDHPRVCGEKS